MSSLTSQETTEEAVAPPARTTASRPPIGPGGERFADEHRNDLMWAGVLLVIGLLLFLFPIWAHEPYSDHPATLGQPVNVWRAAWPLGNPDFYGYDYKDNQPWESVYFLCAQACYFLSFACFVTGPFIAGFGWSRIWERSVRNPAILGLLLAAASHGLHVWADFCFVHSAIACAGMDSDGDKYWDEVALSLNGAALVLAICAVPALSLALLHLFPVGHETDTPGDTMFVLSTGTKEASPPATGDKRAGPTIRRLAHLCKENSGAVLTILSVLGAILAAASRCLSTLNPAH